MITIKNECLSVSIRDPHEDLEQLGLRYCHGGYIWQVYDAASRPLLSGPRYPNPAPPPFDGQGMPEAFKFPELVQPCRWDIDIGDDYVIMATTQELITLRREVRVDGNCIKSTTTVKNIRDKEMTIRWFAHPFFPINSESADDRAGLTSEKVKLENGDNGLTSAKVKSGGNLACGKISPPAILPESAGYYLDNNSMIYMKPDYPWEKGLFQPLEVPPEKLTITIPHPIVGQIILSTGYDVVFCPIWANANTFSFEPFTQRAVQSGEAASWGISYMFGA